MTADASKRTSLLRRDDSPGYYLCEQPFHAVAFSDELPQNATRNPLATFQIRRHEHVASPRHFNMLRSFSPSLAGLLTLLPLVVAQSGVYQQCGGINWTGATDATTATTATITSAAITSSTTSTSTSSTPLPTATSTATLNTVAKAAGKLYFGSATDNPELTDTSYVALLSENTQFGQLTPDATEPSQGTFTFTKGDAVVSLAQANGQLVRAGLHQETLMRAPSRALSRPIVEPWSVTTKEKYSWDVINEPFNDDGTYRTSVFYNTLNTSYISIALTAARAADPAAKLYINDYNIEGTGAKSTAMLNLVKSLQASGVPIDGVGIQGHLIVGSVPSTIQANLQQFTALGIEVAITELDIRMTLPVTSDKLIQQQKDYQTVISACKAVAGCIGVTVWDYTDKYSWVPGTFSGQGAALPWDENLVRKPAYDGIVAGFS
ncbi:hypothetical protein H0H93_000194 [Arthromyces matolae]|nr:hypothetical protein H0H93_000194 [Arthromyces matolae]